MPTRSPLTLDARFNALLTTEARSLARHIETAKPYLSPATHGVWQALQRVAMASHDHEQRLSRLMAELELPFRPGTYQSEITHYHDIDVAALRTRLLEEKTRQADAYRQAIEQAADHPRVAEELKALLGEIQDQIQQLQPVDG